MKAVGTSETPIYSKRTTRRYIPKGSNLHTHRHDNMKSHIIYVILLVAKISVSR
jgi:hypothetical protein